MTRGTRTYLIVTAIVGVLTLLDVSYPFLPMLGMMALIIPGIVLVVAPTSFVYLLAVVPAVVLFEVTRRGRLAIVFGMAAIVAVAVGLPWLGRQTLAREVHRLQSQDIGTLTGPIGPEVLIDTRDDKSANGTSCSELCYQLLRLGAFNVVYMQDKFEVAAFRLKSPDCEIRVRNGAGITGHPVSTCVVEEKTAPPGSVGLQIAWKYGGPAVDRGVWPADIRRVTKVHFTSATSDVRRTVVEAVVPMYPLLIDLGFAGGVPQSWRIAPSKLSSAQEQIYEFVRSSVWPQGRPWTI